MTFTLNSFFLRQLLKIIALYGFIGISSSVAARLLDNDEAKHADITVLETEAQLFTTIRKGISLSIAQCHEVENCIPAVDSNEIKKLLEALNARIDEMTLRQQVIENPNDYQHVLARYTGERDNYNGFLQQLDIIEHDIEAIGIAEDKERVEDMDLEDILTEETEVIIEEQELTSLDEFIGDSANGLPDALIEEEDFSELEEFLDDEDELEIPVDAFDATEF